MRWLMRLFDREQPRRARICELELGRIEVEGIAEAVHPIYHPVSDAPAIALGYRSTVRHCAAPTSGELPHEDVLVATAFQAADFLLDDGSGVALIQIAREQQDVGRAHGLGLERHGTLLRTHVDTLCNGERVRVRGTVVELVNTSIYRGATHTAVIRADEFQRV